MLAGKPLGEGNETSYPSSEVEGGFKTQKRGLQEGNTSERLCQSPWPAWSPSIIFF